MATWFTLCILRAKGGIERYRQEIEPLAIADDKTEETTPSFDVSTLKKNAYVQGIWKEAIWTWSRGPKSLPRFSTRIREEGEGGG